MRGRYDPPARTDLRPLASARPAEGHSKSLRAGHSSQLRPGPRLVRGRTAEMPNRPAPDRYLELLRTRTVVKDGAMGTMVQAAALTDADYGDAPGNVDH